MKRKGTNKSPKVSKRSQNTNINIFIYLYHYFSLIQIFGLYIGSGEGSFSGEPSLRFSTVVECLATFNMKRKMRWRD
jgi:hypothetical protein